MFTKPKYYRTRNGQVIAGRQHRIGKRHSEPSELIGWIMLSGLIWIVMLAIVLTN